MDVASTDQEGPVARPKSGSTIMIRWWHEGDRDAAAADDGSLRGTVLDLGGRTLGHFAGRQALLDLVGRITAGPPQRSSRSRRRGLAEA